MSKICQFWHFFFPSSVKQSHFYVKYQNNNKFFLAFHVSAWELLADLLQEVSEWSRRKRQDLKFHYSLWKPPNYEFNVFQIEEQKVFRFLFLAVVYIIVTQTTQASTQEEITDWIIYWLPWWRQKCRTTTTKPISNLLISKKIWKKVSTALLQKWKHALVQMGCLKFSKFS